MEAWIILIVLFFYMMIQGVIVVIVLWKLSEIKAQMITREDIVEIIGTMNSKPDKFKANKVKRTK